MISRKVVQLGRIGLQVLPSTSRYLRVRHKHQLAMSSDKRGGSEIIKSLNDKREYRLIQLDNGLRALLISDLDGEDDQPEMEEDSGEESDVESEHSDEMSEAEEEEEMDDLEASTTDSDEKKSAAALCIGVGSFSDPDDIPGFAHFLEHMVFMGSEKYPEENNFDDYLSKHGGDSNAWTDHERTCFYFDVERDYFHQALDKWAQFFVGPLLRQDAVDREIEAVDSEYQERIPSDLDRLNQLMAATAKEGNPMSKFLLGNADTLKKLPAERGVDVYGRLRDFFNRHYTAQYMTLAVHSKHQLDTLEKWVRESFSGIHNNGEAPISFQDYKDPFDTDSFRKIYKVIPVETTHKVYLTWAFPPLQHHYRVKPLEYISVLLSHEGEGSIYSYLKKKTWALELTGGNSGDGYDMNSQWSGFDICVTLTDQGLKEVNQVVRTIFEYIAMLQREGPQEWLFHELKVIEETRFRWREKGDPTSYVEKVCDNMQQYPPEHYLTGHKLHFSYDHKLIEDCIKHLRADNCNVMITSSNLTDSDCTLREHWFGTKYGVEDISPDLMALWTDLKDNSALYLPKPNNFIATDFSLRDVPPNELSFVPRQISSSPGCQLYYKKDTKFNVPKGFVYFHLRSPVACESVKMATLLDLFVAILNQNISEPTYPAILAGYEIGCTVDELQEGVVIEVDGFNHKLQEVLNVVVDLLVDFSCSEELFQAMKTQMKKAYHNGIIKPYMASKMLRFAILERRYWTNTDKYQAVDGLTREDLTQMLDGFLGQVLTESLVIGNFTEQEAQSIFSGVMSRLKGRQSKPSTEVSLQENSVLEIPRGQTYCQIRSFNSEDSNSCVFNYYQAVPGNMQKCCLNEVLVTRLREPCFNTLRTKQQLGYSVFSVNHLTCGVIGLGICVECQATKFSVAHVDGQIEKFLLEMRDILASMTQEEFESLIESVITLKKVEDTQMEHEAMRHWREIQDLSYVFDRNQKEIALLKTLTLPMLQDWFTQHYLGDNQRKLSVQIVGSTEEGLSAIQKLPGDNDHVFKCLVDPEQKQSHAITDINDFKKSKINLPNTKIIS